MENLVPYLAHGLSHASNAEPALAESDSMGLMLFSRSGGLLYLSRQARRLLFLANNPIVAPSRTLATTTDVQPQVVALCRRYTAIVEEREVAAAPPEWCHRNGWGGFIFRAHGLREPDEVNTGAVAVSIHYAEPAPLKLMRRSRELGLATKQTEICQGLAAGRSYRQIASHMHISEHTVIDHVRKIYTKLDIRNRSELLAKLLAL